MKHPEIVSQMTLEEKADIVCGKDYWTTKPFEKYGLPSIMVTDGPHGLRKKNDKKDKKDKKKKSAPLGNSVPATCMPPAATVACSWDPEVAFKMGSAIADECIREKVSVLLGPGANIKRSPLCGRNFEYYSEDPYLAGKCAAAFINGVQSKGVGTSLKHFAVNSQEAFRMIVNECADERTLREVYLTQYEIAVKEAQPWTIMNAYNRLNGEYCSQNEWLQKKVLRDEWGFQGLVVTDWGASVDRVPGIKAGTDLEMPSSGKYNQPKIKAAIADGSLKQEELDEVVDRIVDLVLKSKATLENAKDECDYERNHKVAQEAAESSMILMKNDDKILPVSKDKSIAVIGQMAKEPRYQGAGSSIINAIKLDNAWDALCALGYKAEYAQGYVKGVDKVDDALTAEAVEKAKKADVAIVFAGLTEEFEAEGYDRTSIDMPGCHNALIEAVAAANPNTVVVLAGGSVIAMPWLKSVKGLLNSLLGGEAGGTAVARIIAGEVNPSGKTAETYPLAVEDNPTWGNYCNKIASEHKESVYIGYRYYDTAKKEVAFPFGYGLSYTTFEYSDIKLSAKKIDDDGKVTVSFKITNTGDVDGAEVAQVYVKDVESTIFRPEKELKGFAKVFLKAGESKTVEIELGKRAFAFYNVNLGDWQVESGEFEILVGASGRDIKLSEKLTVDSKCTAAIPDYRKTAPSYYTADVQNISDEEWSALYGELPVREQDLTKPIDIYNCLDDCKHTKWGAKFCKLIMKMMGGDEDEAPKEGENAGQANMMKAMALQIPIRNFIAMSMGVMSEKMANGLLDILNDDRSTFKGFMRILGGIPGAIPKLGPLLKSI